MPHGKGRQSNETRRITSALQSQETSLEAQPRRKANDVVSSGDADYRHPHGRRVSTEAQIAHRQAYSEAGCSHKPSRTGRYGEAVRPRHVSATFLSGGCHCDIRP